MRNILYVTYDGLTDSLGQSQILAYLKRLSGLGNNIVILSFEKDEAFKKENAAIHQITTASNLTWIPLRYTKKPPVISTLLDIAKGHKACARLHKKHHFDIVHCRGYVPAIMGRRLQERAGVKFIFDMRGWWPDEKLESGFWDKKIYKPVYSYFKKLEREFFHYANYAVSLTFKGKEEIEKQKLAPASKIGVIPTCVDFDIFRPQDAQTKAELREKLGILPAEKVFVYSGCVGGNYDPDVLIDVFKAFRQQHPESYFLILSKDKLSAGLQQKFADAGIQRMSIYNSPFTEVTNYLRAADVGFIYYKLLFSTIGRSPTKLGEYWASGLPVIAFKGIGDLDHILQKYPASGVLLEPDKAKWAAAIRQLQFKEPETLRAYALDYFHIEKGVKFYQSVYEQLRP
ncbi:MAG: glycosyltransferase [Chitinophagaceae bacterium]|nr:MAG: glycosyltransferase [Chitinophagaceae bacterium]